MDFRSALFTVAISALAIFIGWASSDHGLCTIPIAKKAISGEDATWCWEFWLNRYQQFLTGILSLGAAAGAAWLVYRQIAKAHEQNEIGRRQLAAVSAKLILERISAYQKLEELIAESIARLLSISIEIREIVSISRSTEDEYILLVASSAAETLAVSQATLDQATRNLREARNVVHSALLDSQQRDVFLEAIGRSEHWSLQLQELHQATAAWSKAHSNGNSALGALELSRAYEIINKYDGLMPIISIEYSTIAFQERNRLEPLFRVTIMQTEEPL